MPYTEGIRRFHEPSTIHRRIQVRSRQAGDGAIVQRRADCPLVRIDGYDRPGKAALEQVASQYGTDGPRAVAGTNQGDGRRIEQHIEVARRSPAPGAARRRGTIRLTPYHRCLRSISPSFDGQGTDSVNVAQVSGLGYPNRTDLGGSHTETQVKRISLKSSLIIRGLLSIPDVWPA